MSIVPTQSAFVDPTSVQKYMQGKNEAKQKQAENVKQAVADAEWIGSMATKQGPVDYNAGLNPAPANDPEKADPLKGAIDLFEYLKDPSKGSREQAYGLTEGHKSPVPGKVDQKI